jgi:hypothetical protein
MSIGATTLLQQAPALVHRKPVRGGLVLPGADPDATTWTSPLQRHAGGQCLRSDIGAAPFAAVDMRSNALHLRRRDTQSP